MVKDLCKIICERTDIKNTVYKYYDNLVKADNL